MDGRPNRQTENFIILQDFVSIRVTVLFVTIKPKEKVKQGKGTADHLMLLGYFRCSYIMN